MGGSFEGCGYDNFGLGIEICVGGAVGNGKKAKLEVFTNNSDLTSQGKVGEKAGWDGSAVNFSNWHSGGAAGCTVTASNIRVQQSKKNDNEVLVTVRVELDNCSAQGSNSPYFRCGGEGPHVLETSTTVTMKEAPGCNDGAIIL